MSDNNRNSYEAWNPIRFLVFTIFINPAVGSLLLGVLAVMLWQVWDLSALEHSRWIAAFGIGIFEIAVIGASLCQQMGMTAGSREITMLRERLESVEEERDDLERYAQACTTVSLRLSQVFEAFEEFRCDRPVSPRRINTLLMDIAELLREAKHMMVVGDFGDEEGSQRLKEKADELVRLVNSLDDPPRS